MQKNQNFIEIENNLGMWVGEFRNSLKKYSPLNKNVDFIGYYIQIKEEIWDRFQISYQIFKHDTFFSIEQIKLIVHHVNKAYNLKTNISKQPALEFLLYLSQKNQISKAINQVGVSPPSNPLDLFIFNEILFGEPSKINNAKKYLDKKLPLISNTRNTIIKPMRTEYWEQFIKKYEISIPQLINILYSYNIYTKLNEEEIKSIADLLKIEEITENLLRKSITDSFNAGMVKLFLDNYKNPNN